MINNSTMQIPVCRRNSWYKHVCISSRSGEPQQVYYITFQPSIFLQWLSTIAEQIIISGTTQFIWSSESSTQCIFLQLCYSVAKQILSPPRESMRHIIYLINRRTQGIACDEKFSNIPPGLGTEIATRKDTCCVGVAINN